MNFSPLHLKLIRDLGRMKGQTIAVSLVMACGLAMMIMARSLTYSLESTRDQYYEQFSFGDVFADLKRAPNFLRPRLAEIPDVAAVDTRVTGRLTLDLPGQAEPADGVVLSLPDDRPQRLNKLFLRRGRYPEPGRRGEVVVGEAFANSHGFGPGNTVDVLMRGQRETLTIVGIALSPEYVFEARPGETLPDNQRFGVFWMNERELATALDLDGAFNNVLVDVAPGGDTLAVIAELDRLLANYGALGAITRVDHPSAARLNDELAVLATLAIAFPLVFLSIAAFMSSAVLSRLVRLQREQIAQLKAFGYSARDVGFHYFQFALVIVALGTIVGVLGGFWLGGQIVEIYHRFFKFPSLTFQPDYSAILTAFVVSAGASFLGVWGSVRMAMKLPPAEAMRPEPPVSYRASIAERLGLSRFLSPTFRMALRNIERRPWQAFFTAFGLALATGIPVVPCTMREGIEYLLNFQWDVAQRQNVTVALFEPASSTAVSDIRHLPGVLHVETFRSVPARIRFGNHSRKLAVTGLARDARLNRVLDARERPIPLPPDGLLVSAKLAEILGAAPGDIVTLEIQEGSRPRRETVIRGLITDYAGVFAYMDKDSLHQLMREGPTVSGAYVSLDANQWLAFLQEVKNTPRIAAMMIKNAVRDSFRKTTAETINMVQYLYFVFSIIVACGVVYNSARIALSERSRDLATLRVIGFSHREVAGVLVTELMMLTVVAIPVGLLLGSALSAGIIVTASTESVRLPLRLVPESYATAVIIVLSAAVVSFAIVGRRIRDLDLIGVLKARD